jgi:membrane-bound lytic murein transglycosylase D
MSICLKWNLLPLLLLSFKSWAFLGLPQDIAQIVHKHQFLRKEQVDKELANKWFHYFRGRGKTWFQSALARGELVRPEVERIFEQNSLPKELYYIGLIESGYQNHALSRAKAKGPWQFMKATAKQYGLKVNSKVDERTDLIKSTRAAASYLRDLYNFYQDWALALAAYNAGEYRVLNAIRKAKTRKFNQLIKRKILAKETQNYVSKIWVAMKLGKNVKRYGFKTPQRGKILQVRSPQRLKNFGIKDLMKGDKVVYARKDKNKILVRVLRTGEQIHLNSNNLE